MKEKLDSGGIAQEYLDIASTAYMAEMRDNIGGLLIDDITQLIARNNKVFTNEKLAQIDDLLSEVATRREDGNTTATLQMVLRKIKDEVVMEDFNRDVEILIRALYAVKVAMKVASNFNRKFKFFNNNFFSA